MKGFGIGQAWTEDYGTSEQVRAIRRGDGRSPEQKDDAEEAESVYFRIAKDAYLRLKAKYEPDE